MTTSTWITLASLILTAISAAIAVYAVRSRNKTDRTAELSRKIDAYVDALEAQLGDVSQELKACREGRAELQSLHAKLQSDHIDLQNAHIRLQEKYDELARKVENGA